ncbi:MAG: ABC transporter ATP-binding protein/permease [Anaerolineae bacterium]|nr:ABC transporter ATP-binding protein/permease [Anaerolineae bacterium]
MLSPRFKTFVSYYTPYRAVFALSMGAALLGALIAVCLPLVARDITQKALAAAPLADVLSVGGLMLALIVLYALCDTVMDWHGHRLGALIEGDMRADLFAHYQTLSFRYYDDHKTGEMMSRITGDLLEVSELCHHGPEDLAIATLKLVGAFVVLLAIDVPLALLVLAFMPFLLAYALVFYRRMVAALRRSRTRIAEVNTHIEDSLSGVRVVQAFTNASAEQAQFDHYNRRFIDSRVDGYRNEALYWGGIVLFSELISLLVVVVGALRIASGALSPADLVAFILCVGILIDPIRRAVNLTRLLQDGITGFERFMEVMETPPDIQDSPNATDLAGVRGEIRFDDVTFRYRSEHRDVLSHLNLTIAAGEYVALVGASGVGKTTLCALIPRFYEASSGAVRVDGHDVRSVTLRSLRQHIGIVQQDVYLFSGTVADNIAYGKPGASRAEVIEAAQAANAHAFIMALPDGYDTDIGQRGVKLSGGQKQRLSIARAFLKNPPILIFDEATSSLDYESEQAVQQAVERLAHGRTLIVIAHRLSTIQRAQRILVLTEGGIAEQGTHDALMQRGGAYASLYRTQATI